MSWPTPITLSGKHASLLPLRLDHAPELAAAACDGELWRLWYTSVPEPQRMMAEVERRLQLQAQGMMLPFTVVDASGRIVGMTSYMNVDAVHRRLEIGGTWYAAAAQRTALNTESKLMLMTHAFEALGCIAVEFRTHRLNMRSRQAIERLGAQLDGILRNHQHTSNGLLRDTCVYSVINTEWPTIKTHLRWQLDVPR